jgi:hypothetical protein
VLFAIKRILQQLSRCAVRARRIPAHAGDHEGCSEPAHIQAQKLAWPDIPSHDDVFHIHQQFETLLNIWARIAGGARSEREALEALLPNPVDAVRIVLSSPGLPNFVRSKQGRISRRTTFVHLPGG